MTTDQRPNPDRLLAQVASQESKQKRGRLKVFFGAAPGVGKTFAMLEEGRKRAGEGMDVVVGYAEPHARMETEALLIGMDLLPYKTVEYRNSTLKEFDMDAAMARRPHLILVDELAHTNAPGMRHPKRWQDVVEILDAGIHVYTTLNVQHLESVNDVVERITGVKVRETLPDAVLEQADEIELIDTAPDELLERFREGKVYRPEQAAQASRHFFTKGNLIALRELALRRTAERVDQQMQDFREEHRVGETWAASERILVCVGPSPLSSRLVRSSKRLASGLKASWIAANVEKPGGAVSSADQARVEANLKLAEELGAETITLSGANLAEELTAFARSRNVTKIVIGKPRRPRWKEVLFGSAVDELIRRSGVIDVYVIRGEEEADSEPVEPAAATRPFQVSEIVRACAAVAVAAAAGFPLYYNLGLSNTNVLMLFLLAVLFTATRYSRSAAIVAAVVGVLCFDFLFVPPEYSLTVRDREYLVTFVVMLLTAIIISTLTHRLRDQALAARIRERRTSILYALTRDLSISRSVQEIAAAAVRHAGESLSRKIAVLTPAESRQLSIISGGAFSIDAKELATAQWVFEHDQTAGRGTSTLPQSTATYLPLTGAKGSVGVLAIEAAGDGPDMTRGQQQLAEAIATQVGLAIDRIQYADQARLAWEKVESELLRNTLLSGVSHELRTPLATITGALSTAIDSEPAVHPDAQRELLASALDEAQRMDRLINNLLDMTRVESGGLRLKRDWYGIAELVQSAVKHIRPRLKSRQVHIRLSDDLPMLRLDGLMTEQVLINLLDNAVEYTPADSPIEIAGSALAGELRLDISDRGPGFGPGVEKRVFEKFFRADHQTARRGIGLGLAICRGIIEAHGGRIAAFNRAGGGATFSITWPIEPMPAVSE